MKRLGELSGLPAAPMWGAASIIPTTYQTITQPSPSGPALGNSWVNYGGTDLDLGYWKDTAGIVHIHGAIKSGTTTAGILLFTLPAGYRPANTVVLPMDAYDTFNAHVEILSTGEVKLYGANATKTSLSGVQFRAA